MRDGKRICGHHHKCTPTHTHTPYTTGDEPKLTNHIIIEHLAGVIITVGHWQSNSAQCLIKWMIDWILCLITFVMALMGKMVEHKCIGGV